MLPLLDSRPRSWTPALAPVGALRFDRTHGALRFDRTHGALARLHMRCSRVLTRNWLRSDSVRAATIPAVGLYLHDALRLGRAEGPLFKVHTTVPQSTHKSAPKKCPQCPNSTHPLAVGKGDAPTHGARPPLPLATKLH